jgi:Carboxypeptidase regulatory-like domain
LSNAGFHAPPQHPGWTFDGTAGNTGYSSTPWVQTQNAANITWSSETFAQNQNANALRWSTLYNIRFDSNMPPAIRNVSIGFFKTGAPITVLIQAPSAAAIPVSVSGRVTTSTGRGVSNARVFITDSSGNARMTITSPFGYYSFDNVAAGATYTIMVSAKLYLFTSQMLQVNDNLSNVNFVAEPLT